MKQILALIGIILGAAANPAAARYFNHRYTLHSGGNFFTCALQDFDKIYTINICNDSINYVGGGAFKATNGIRFSVMDTNGNLLLSTLTQLPQKKLTATSISNNMQRLEDGTFLLAFGVMDTAVAPYNPAYFEMHTAIAVFDSLGNMLSMKEFDRQYCNPLDATNHLLEDFKKDQFGNWIMLASLICNSQVVCYLHKMDKDFNTIWVKTFKTGIIHNHPKHLLIEENGYIMSGDLNNSNITLPANYVSSLLIKCDTAGTVLWDWKNRFDTDSLQYTINDIIRTKDRAYVYCGSGFGKPTFFDGKSDWSDISVYGLVEKLDSNRNSIWKTKLSVIPGIVSATEQVVVKELPGGDIMVAGTVGESYDPDDSTKGWIRGSLARLDSKDGHIIWQRFYKSPDGNDTMILKFNDMRPTPDGGYLLAGEARNYIDRGGAPTQQGWMVRVDSNGCLGPGDPQCKPLAIHQEQLTVNALQVYPNPAHSILSLRNSTGEKVQCQICDMIGNTLLSQSAAPYSTIQFNIANLPLALYIYHIYSNGMLIQSGKFVKQ